MIETKFKQTEIGLIPEDWEIKSLGDVCVIKGRIGFRGYTVKDLVRKGFGAISLSPSNITRQFELDFSDCTYISWFKYEESPEIKVAVNDILFVKTGSTYGKTALIKFLPEKATINPQFALLKNIQCNPFFLSSALVQPSMRKQVDECVVGGAVRTMSQKKIESFLFPLPKDKQEQSRIAEALSNIDKLIFSLSKTIEKKRLIKQGAMQQLLTGKKRLPGFDGEWVEYRMEDDVNRFATGLNPRQNFTLNSSGSNNYYVTIKNFREGHLYLDDNCDRVNDYAIELINRRSDLRSGDVLMSSIGRIGDAYVIKSNPKNWNINESVFSLRPDYNKITSLFLYYTIKGDSMQEQMKGGSTGSTLTSIKMSHLKELVCYIPTSIEEQSAITNNLSTMDNEIESLEEERCKNC